MPELSEFHLFSENPVSEEKASAFVWTDQESSLLLEVILKYKTASIGKGVQWESVRDKYPTIHSNFVAEVGHAIEAGADKGKGFAKFSQNYCNDENTHGQ